MKCEKVKSLIDEMERARAKMKKEGKAALTEAFQEFFTAAPEVKAIKWIQSIPSFNDGDPCVFSVHELMLKLSKKGMEELLGRKMTKDEYDAHFEEYDSDEWSLQNASNARAKEVASLFREFVRAVQYDELFQEVFGDGAEVIATPGKFKCEDYYGD